MIQEKINKYFQTDLGRQCFELYSTSDDRVFIRMEEAVQHTNGQLDADTFPLSDKNIKIWYCDDDI